MSRWLHAFTLHPPRDHRDELVRFITVGGCGYLLAMALFGAGAVADLSPYVVLPPVFIINGLFNFALNRVWSFPASGRAIGDELWRFAVVAAGSLTVNYATLYLLHTGLGVAAVPAQGLAILAAVPVGFLGNKLFSFALRPEPHA